MTILGISLGTRTTGLAIVKGQELLTAQTITLRNKASRAHVLTIDRYIRQYRIVSAVIKMPPSTHISARLKALLRQCIRLFEYHGCMVDYKDAKRIKERLPAIANKKALIEFATRTYPVLTPLDQRELANKQKYHVKMFEAVVIAHLKKTKSEPSN